MASRKRVFVVGVGMTKFEKPGRRADFDYPQMAKIAGEQALADAGIPYDAVQQACVGYVYGDSTCGQRAVYGLGLSGIPVYNVNNNCSTGSTALFMAKQFVEGGLAECVLALGFEKMQRGSLASHFDDRTNPMDQHVMTMMEVRGMAKAPVAPQMFGNAGIEHMEKYGTKPEHFAKIAEKNHRHSRDNPRSQFRDVYSLDQIMGAKTVYGPLTKLQCCPTSDGAGAAILCSEEFVYKYGLQKKAIEIVGMSMVTDMPSTFKEKSMIKMVGYDMTKKAAEDVYRQSGYGPQDVQVIELHDCFSCNELITYEGLGLCPEGKAGQLVDAGDNTYGGKWVINPSGGLISKGHPLGATGLAQCAELNWQLRNECGKRQVKGAKIALQHNLGLGGAAVVTMYKKPTDLKAPAKVPIGRFRSDSVGSAGAVSDDGGAAAAGDDGSDNAGGATESVGDKLKATAVFEQMKKRLNATMVKKVGVVYRFDVSGGAGGAQASWVVNLKQGDGSVTEGKYGSGKADCIIIMKDADLIKLMSGKLNPQSAFMQGQLKIKGNMMLAQKLGALVQKKSNL
eukprot:TRINITY_DN60378_c1_g1_i1.p1 TRINITY_DN60378_c1_g1~~TRINITY_DN60378_c1_g1_i1.p1  ORF type:complete len:565 (+),score=347.26 TRINITY_DN60378_c1_g1_i1:104-1798(+)